MSGRAGVVTVGIDELAEGRDGLVVELGAGEEALPRVEVAVDLPLVPDCRRRRLLAIEARSRTSLLEAAIALPVERQRRREAIEDPRIGTRVARHREVE